MPPTAGNLVASSDSVTSVPTKEEDIATRNFGDNGNQKLVQHSSEISQLQRSAMTRSTGVLIHETFETGTLGIFTSSDSGFWKVHNRSTASSNTGPVGGDNSKYYVHAESSANFPTRTEYLTSNVFSKTVGYFLGISFSYHMHGDDMGTLALEVMAPDSYDTGWSLLWNQSGQTHENSTSDWAVVNLEDTSTGRAYSSQLIIRFKMTTANGYKGDAAIDSIMVQEYILPSTTPTSAGNKLD
ncbi:hypothetical protein CYMTET_4063 [Cymbomonas tetramitiformis]|uniref:MAM domain-containing protein n=1 Tax=Cymbomonas tetramitiformis TaxID=36881 RepID=A0AAE0H257_9CHLO|nr:hypothetical protein CYMTET_4063 [Cymbomonas tetramitiformis]